MIDPAALARRDLLQNPLEPEEAEALLGLEGAEAHLLLAAAALQRERHRGRRVALCAILNARSGRCPEDCAFCAQSARFDTGAPVYAFLDPGAIVERAKSAAAAGARRFSIVTSGKALSGRERETARRAVRLMAAEAPVRPCASLGILPEEALRDLASAGLARYHHNLETSRSFFPNICSTHDYGEDVECIRAARRAGLEVCAGGLFGLGESDADRVELAFTLKELDIDAAPINFLSPIPGTPLGARPRLSALEALKIVAVFRLVLPEKEILVAGGRADTLGELQPFLLAGGASGLMIGDYLTTPGASPAQDLRMLERLELEAC